MCQGCHSLTLHNLYLLQLSLAVNTMCLYAMEQNKIDLTSQFKIPQPLSGESSLFHCRL